MHEPHQVAQELMSTMCFAVFWRSPSRQHQQQRENQSPHLLLPPFPDSRKRNPYLYRL